MTWRIAIAPDDNTKPATPDRRDASSPLWAQLLEKAGCEIRWVDVRSADILDQLEGCHGFMWRWGHFNGMGRIARRLLPTVEQQLGLLVYPDYKTCWHYDDKIAQAYLLKAARIPIPRTWIWFDHRRAREWAAQATYPLVLKLATGAGAANVRLVQTADEAALWIDRLFRERISRLDAITAAPMTFSARIRAAARALFLGYPPPLRDNGFETQSGYVLFQELLTGNEYDTRITIIGNRAFGFRRLNREHDFRASGSGRIDWTPEKVDPAFVKLGYRTAKALGLQSCAIDGLYSGGQPVITEISYTYVSWAVHECPGHWHLRGESGDAELSWTPGSLWPEEAQVEDFLAALKARYPHHRNSIS